MVKKTRGISKAGLVEIMVAKSGESKKHCNEILELCLQSIIKGLKEHNQVTLIGFGTFLVQQRQARDGYNPQTGVKMHIPAFKQPSFRAGKNLKDQVNSRK